jgi:4-hydroxy-tetrahydrodipicolinate synthase
VIGRVVKRVAGRAPVIAGTGSNATHEAISLTQKAAQLGADACLLVTPYYNKPTQEGLYQHYKAIAEAVEIPQILYNVPGRTMCDLLPATVERLATVTNIVGLKDATGDLSRIQQLRDNCPDGFLLYSGDDATPCEFCLNGGDGVISVTANVAPHLMHQMIVAAMVGDRDAAESMNAKLSGLHQDLFLESNPIPVKWAVHEMGLIARNIRLPLTWLDSQYEEPVRAAMRMAGLD